MSLRTNNEFEISEQSRGDERRFIIIEYEVTRKEINRYDVVVKEMK